MSTSDLPSRRQVLTGRVLPVPPPEAHISSLVVHVRPEHAAATRAALAALPGLEVHAEQAGKFIVTLETLSEADIVTRMNDVSLLPGVMSTALVFHHCEPAEDVSPPAAQG